MRIDDPQDAEVANMYNRNRQEFNDHAKSWVQKHASVKVWPRESKIRILEDMGIDREIAKVGLSLSLSWKTTGNAEKASLECRFSS